MRRETYFGQNTPHVSDRNGDYTKPINLRKRYYRILKAAEIEQKGLHSLQHTFATNLVNGQKQPDGTIRVLSPRQAADLLGHSTSQITKLYYVKKDTARLSSTLRALRCNEKDRPDENLDGQNLIRYIQRRIIFFASAFFSCALLDKEASPHSSFSLEMERNHIWLIRRQLSRTNTGGLIYEYVVFLPLFLA